MPVLFIYFLIKIGSCPFSLRDTKKKKMENDPLVKTIEGSMRSYDSIIDESDSDEQEHEAHDRPPHRFHYTYDDRTLDECTHYFDLSEFSVSNGKGLDVEELSSFRRRRSQDEEESIYFESFDDEILPREGPVGPRQRLSPLALSVLVFYNVSGGPFGMERAVKSGGPMFAILGFIIFPLIWSIPEALVTAELGTAYPEPSGSM